MMKALNDSVAPTRTASGDSLASPLDGSWAHASGWNHRSIHRRTVSCVMLCRDQGPALTGLLPQLSDLLTEGGYPWELIALDCDSSDGTAGLLSVWTRFVGVQWVHMPRNTNTAAQFAAGLTLARGDAVIFVDPAMSHSPTLIPAMMRQWESQALLVYAVRNEGSDVSRLMQWNAKTLQLHREARADFALPPGVTQLSLMDRKLVELLAARR